MGIPEEGKRVGRVGHRNRWRPAGRIGTRSALKKEERWSDRGTHGLQPLGDAIHSVLVSVSVLVVRKRIERILALIILCRISPPGMSVRTRRGSDATPRRGTCDWLNGGCGSGQDRGGGFWNEHRSVDRLRGEAGGRFCNGWGLWWCTF